MYTNTKYSRREPKNAFIKLGWMLYNKQLLKNKDIKYLIRNSYQGFKIAIKLLTTLLVIVILYFKQYSIYRILLYIFPP